MRILLVEDEAPLRETLAARLKREGFAVDAAQDGEEGLYMGREVPFDVGIIDLGQRSGFAQLRGDVKEVEQVRAADHRFGQGCRLQQIVPAVGYQAAADKRAVPKA